MGILEKIEIGDKFYDITTEKIAQRVYDNKQAFKKKFAKKNLALQKYYESDKVFV